MSKIFNIAIDGPAGAGKSTIARKAAEKLGFVYVDTGAMYRAIGLYFLANNIDLDDDTAIENACRNIKITIEYKNSEQQIILNGENVSGKVRTEEAGKMASKVSVFIPVREKLVELQKELAMKENVIMDGRDIGTCVLPDADVKIYLTAGSRVRAMRRLNELKEKGIESDIEEIEKNIIERDKADMTRENSPLKQADDAILIDSSDMNIDEVINSIINAAAAKGLKVY